jgi:hypothetical protein
MSEARASRRGDCWCLMLLLAAATCTAALAQQSPAPAPVPPPEQLEPRVDTSAISSGEKSAPAVREPANATAASTQASSAPTRPAGGPVPSAAAATAPGATPASAAAAPAAPTRGKKGPDRLELEATDITGNRELPKVLYIVPWKRADLGDLIGKPTNSLLDEVLQPLDRDVFQRENRYYDALKSDATPAPAPAAPLSGAKP